MRWHWDEFQFMNIVCFQYTLLCTHLKPLHPTRSTRSVKPSRQPPKCTRHCSSWSPAVPYLLWRPSPPSPTGTASSWDGLTSTVSCHLVAQVLLLSVLVGSQIYLVPLLKQPSCTMAATMIANAPARTSLSSQVIVSRTWRLTNGT